MSVVASATPAREPDSLGAVFHSYAREDAAAALMIATELRRLFWDPIWDARRSDPRFQQLLATLGCTAEYATARATQERLLRERKAGR